MIIRRLAPLLLLFAVACHSEQATDPAVVPTLQNLQRAMDARCENLANAQTIGYKRVVPTFAGPVPTMLRDYSQGSPYTTNNPLDLAIEGNGFFQLEDCGKHVFYTRNGNFALDDTGVVVLASNPRLRLTPQIHFPTYVTSITITSKGNVRCTVPGDTIEQTIGQIQLGYVNSSNSLVATKEGLFTTEAYVTMCDPGEMGVGALMSHALESSNVDVDAEMRALLKLVRLKEKIAHAP